MARTWTPAQRRSQGQQMRSRWSDPAERQRLLRRRTLGTIEAALKRDASIGEEIMALVISTKDES